MLSFSRLEKPSFGHRNGFCVTEWSMGTVGPLHHSLYYQSPQVSPTQTQDWGKHTSYAHSTCSEERRWSRPGFIGQWRNQPTEFLMEKKIAFWMYSKEYVIEKKNKPTALCFHKEANYQDVQAESSTSLLLPFPLMQLLIVFHKNHILFLQLHCSLEFHYIPANMQTIRK